jgi:hypothetical protein
VIPSPFGLSGLRLHRAGKEWIISCGTFSPEFPESRIEWSPLVDAAMRIKMAAIKIFPDLLEAIEKSQDRMVVELTRASATYDEFAKTLDMARAMEDGKLKQLNSVVMGIHVSRTSKEGK